MIWIQLVLGVVPAGATVAAAWYARDRRRRRVERIGEIVEEIFWAAGRAEEGLAPPAEWMAKRNELRDALVGLGDRLKECTDLVNTSSMAGSRRRPAQQAPLSQRRS